MRLLRRAPGDRADSTSSARPRRSSRHSRGRRARRRPGRGRGGGRRRPLAARDGTRCILFGPAQRSRRRSATSDAGGARDRRRAARRSPTTTSRRGRCARSPTRRSCRRRGRVAEGRADALVSAGSTGAALAAALLHVKRLPGVLPAGARGAVPMPGRPRAAARRRRQRRGAARAPGPVRLHGRGLQRAACSGVERPRVGLLSVGEEPGKGTPDVVAAHAQLAAQRRSTSPATSRATTSPAASVGRRRHRRLHRQRRAEADGGDGADDRRRRSATRSAPAPLSKLGGLLLRPKLARLREQLDPEERRRRLPARPARPGRDLPRQLDAAARSRTRSRSPSAGSRRTSSRRPPRRSRAAGVLRGTATSGGGAVRVRRPLIASESRS